MYSLIIAHIGKASHGTVLAAIIYILREADMKNLLYHEWIDGAQPATQKNHSKPIENETHVLVNCPLYRGIKTKNNCMISNTKELIDMLSNPNLEPHKTVMLSKTVHEILSVNESYTCYYKSQEFHNKTGVCVIL